MKPEEVAAAILSYNLPQLRRVQSLLMEAGIEFSIGLSSEETYEVFPTPPGV